MDVGLVVTYVVSYLARKAAPIADEAVERLLSGLFEQVRGAVGDEPAVAQLEARPADDAAQAKLHEALSRAVEADVALASQLEGLTAALERQGAERPLVNAAPINGDLFQRVVAREQSVVGNSGTVVYNTTHNTTHNTTEVGGSDPDWRDAPALAKVLVVVGFFTLLGGLGALVYAGLAWSPSPGEPGFAETPPGVPLAFVAMFVGVGLFAVGGMVAAMSRRGDPEP